MREPRRTIFIACFALCLSLFVTVGPARAERARIGVLAKRGYEQCLKRWQPLASYLSGRIPGVTFTIVPLDFEEVERVAHSGGVEFIITNPAIYFHLEYSGDAVDLATLDNLRLGKGYTVFGGVIVARADNGKVNGIEDLVDRKVMAVSLRSFGGWIMVWRELAEHGIHPERDFASLRFGGTQDAVIYAVRDGLVDVGCVRTDTLERMAGEGKIKLADFKVINQQKPTEGFPFSYSTRLYPEWPFARTRNTPEPLARKVASALFLLSENDRAAQAAGIAGWAVPVDYGEVGRALEELRIGPFATPAGYDLAGIVRLYWPWLGGTVLLLLFTAGGALYWQGMHRRLAAAMSESDRVKGEMELVFESSSEAIRQIDLNYRIVRVNRAMLAMLGRSADEVVGRHCYELFHSPICHTEMCTLRRIKDKGALEISEEIRKEREDGSCVDCLVTTVPFVDLKGNLRGILEYFRDIGERVEAEERLRASEELFRNLADSSSDLLLMHQGGGKILFASRVCESMLKVSADQLIDTEIITLVHPDDHGRFLDVVARISEQRTSGSIEVLVRRFDGSWFDAEVSGFLVEGPASSVRQAAVFRDISERRTGERKVAQALDEARQLSLELCEKNDEMEAGQNHLREVHEELRLAHEGLKNAQIQLVQRKKMATIGQLAAGVAHEINNPTGFVNSNLTTLNKYHQRLVEYITALEDALSSGKVELEALAELKRKLKIDHIAADLPELVAESLDGCERIRKIVMSLKNFSRVDSEDDSAEADINQCLESTLDIVWNELKYKAKVEKMLGDIPRTWCNPQQLNQVFMNLLVNAGHAISDSGTITITTTADDGNIVITIADTGCGMSDEVREKIFEPFFTTKGVGKGTGLGLSIVMDIIQRHGGKISVESEVGRGTTFTIAIPVRKKAA